MSIHEMDPAAVAKRLNNPRGPIFSPPIQKVRKRALPVNPFGAFAMMNLAVFIGGGSLLLFGIFLFIGPIAPLRPDVSESQALFGDALLSVLFFFQHSGMIRKSFRNRLAFRMPAHYHPSFYAIASGMALATVVLLWQPSQTILYQAEGLVRLSARVIAAAAVVGFAWGVRALDDLDAFGLGPIRAHHLGKPFRTPKFTVRGPYRWVRHPLYFFVLVLIWSNPDIGLDRLLFNVLWTLWILYGTRLEEKDLVGEFGELYRRYQETVPMLVPWRLPRGSGP